MLGMMLGYTVEIENLKSKIDIYRNGLQQWSIKMFRNMKRHIYEITKRIELLSKGKINDSINAELAFLHHQLEELLEKKDTKWKQRSKMHWMYEGYQNTSYFHACASERRMINTIIGLQNTGEFWCTKDIEIQ
ncbi:hypothetical protein ACH5RR_018194 [Cinchona calisaya]|uniref:Uncharacterized protein n=1 Tax=Cinchona calisaya TaxID=153742 RepID=A0ABD2ZNX3_9GENT